MTHKKIYQLLIFAELRAICIFIKKKIYIYIYIKQVISGLVEKPAFHERNKAHNYCEKRILHLRGRDKNMRATIESPVVNEVVSRKFPIYSRQSDWPIFRFLGHSACRNSEVWMFVVEFEKMCHVSSLLPSK